MTVSRAGWIVVFALCVSSGGCVGSAPDHSTPAQPAVTVSSAIVAGELPFRQYSGAARPPERRKALQAVLDRAVAAKGSTGVRGIAAAVVSAGGSWTGAAGADGDGRPVVPSAMMGIGSITKTLTAAEVVHLARIGKVDLDAPASKYLDHHLLTRGPTVRQLLSMNSGIPDILTDAFGAAVSADPARRWTAQDALTYADDPLAAPGGDFAYSNSNYLLLGLLIEKVTGLSYAAALRRDVLVGSDDRIAVQPAEAPAPPMAVPDPAGEARPDGRYLPNLAVASAAGSAGAIAADALAVAHWGYQLYGGLRLPSEQVQDLARTTTSSGLGTEVGYYSDSVTVGHQGEIAGYISNLLVVVSHQVAVAVLMLVDGRPLFFVQDLLRAALA